MVSIELKPAAKERKKHNRRPNKSKVTAMLALGATRDQIAEACDIGKVTVSKITSEVKEAVLEADKALAVMKARIQDVMPAQTRVDKYVELLNIAQETNQPSAGMAILTRLDNLDGVITELDQIKNQTHAASAPQPMFILPPGANVAVTFNAPSDRAINVTPHAEVVAERSAMSQPTSGTGDMARCAMCGYKHLASDAERIHARQAAPSEEDPQ